MDRDHKIPVYLHRDQIQNLRGLINKELSTMTYRPAYLEGLLNILDDAETAGTIENARKGPWERALELDRAMYPDQNIDLDTLPYSGLEWGLTGRMSNH